MRLLISAVLILVCTILLAACGTTKKFYKECEKIENGFMCEE